jgi:hypothetical protein
MTIKEGLKDPNRAIILRDIMSPGQAAGLRVDRIVIEEYLDAYPGLKLTDIVS